MKIDFAVFHQVGLDAHLGDHSRFFDRLRVWLSAGMVKEKTLPILRISYRAVEWLNYLYCSTMQG